MLFTASELSESEAGVIEPRLLAHIGDAVFHLYERERELQSAQTVSQLHMATTRRASAAAQADLLDSLAERLRPKEQDLVRRARNIKPQRQHRNDQAAYRKSTAFEALIGYLYLTDGQRLKQLLDWTLPEGSKSAPSLE
ncbi:MAG TPA: ribonuclease III domain-containing protein [Candidatus Obscuribacterales bacterium]